MEQQQAPFNESISSAERHEEASQYSGYFPDSGQQKLFPQHHRMAATAGQRLLLALVSLTLLLGASISQFCSGIKEWLVLL